MALEDLFKVVKDRSKADTKPKTDAKTKKPAAGVEIPKGLLSSVRDAAQSFTETISSATNRSVPPAITMHA